MNVWLASVTTYAGETLVLHVFETEEQAQQWYDDADIVNVLRPLRVESITIEDRTVQAP